MRKFAAVVGLVLAASVAPSASAQTYNFNVLYNGDSTTTLAPGSDNPIGTNILPGDSFLWTFAAQTGAYWNVNTGGDFFALAALAVNEAGVRYGDFTFTLFRNSVSVFTHSEVAARNNYVHVGTNDLTLATGLQFDVMQLSYTLLSAVDDPEYGGDPVIREDINTTLRGTMPIFDPPELNQYEPGIDYVTASTVTPEPASMVLMLTGMGAIGAVVRRRRKA